MTAPRLRSTETEELIREERAWIEYDRKYKMVLKDILVRMEHISKNRATPLIQGELLDLQKWINEEAEHRRHQQMRYGLNLLILKKSRSDLDVCATASAILLSQETQRLRSRLSTDSVYKEGRD